MNDGIRVLIRLLTPDFKLENEKGCLVQLVHEGWKQVNIITSYANYTRGGHYHKYNKECFYIVKGRINLKVWRDEIYENYEVSSGDMFIIPEYVFHIFEYYEDTTLISLYSNGVELPEGKKDIWNVEAAKS